LGTINVLPVHPSPVLSFFSSFLSLSLIFFLDHGNVLVFTTY